MRIASTRGWPLVSTGKSLSFRPLSEITASAQLAACTSIPMCRSIHSLPVGSSLPFSLGIVESSTRGCPTMPGGTNLPVLRGLGCSSQTPWPYDAYSHTLEGLPRRPASDSHGRPPNARLRAPAPVPRAAGGPYSLARVATSGPIRSVIGASASTSKPKTSAALPPSIARVSSMGMPLKASMMRFSLSGQVPSGCG